METRGRALYNLIRMNWEEDPTLPVTTWQVEDLSKLETKNLFHRLEQLGIVLDEERFLAYGQSISSPEELTDTVCLSEDATIFNQSYLLIFEIWKRFFPEKQSLSIFCDQLDTFIDLYDQDLLENEDQLQKALSDLECILDEHVDQGKESKEVFQEVSLYCAHDLESFIYDFISDQIDANHDLYASELLDAFGHYMQDEKWFAFLRMRLTASTDLDEVSEVLSNMLEEQKENQDFEFLLEIARFLIHHGAISYFVETIRLMKPLIQTEQDFQELLAIASQFYRLLDQEEKADKIYKILKKRKMTTLEKEIASNDKAVEEFFQLAEDLDRSEA